MNRTGHVIFLILTAFLISMTLAACATVPKETDLKESLKNSAEFYWGLRIKDKYEEAYKMEDREKLPVFSIYINKAMAIKKMNILSYSIKEIKILGNKGEVEVEFSYVVPITTKPFRQVIKDTWSYENSKWWHRLQD